jgi:putative tryptophan/tyrosine transport system substrate-binding protein
LKLDAGITRRSFAALAAALALRPALAQAGSPARVGVLVLGSSAERDDVDRQLLRGLNELGYVEGRNLVLERRYADSQASRLPGFAQEFAARDSDVIVTTCTPSTRAVRGATQRIPIVMVAVADPVGSAFVHSLAQPGTNVTGRSSQSKDIVAKMMSLFLRAASGAGPMAVLVNANNIAHEALWREAAQAAPALRLELRRVELRSAENPHGEDLPPAFERLSAAGARSVFMLPDDPISVINRARLAALAAQHRLPALYGASEFTEAGGLMSYGENLGDSARQSARHVARLLAGADPATLPVEQPTRFELVLNLKTAQALRLSFPQDLRLLADRVIG